MNDSSTWIGTYLPILILLFIIIPHQHGMRKAALLKMKKRKGVISMTNELIKKYIGMNCKISTGSFGTTIVGKIVDVKENWLEVETRKGKELINADFVQNIKVK